LSVRDSRANSLLVLSDVLGELVRESLSFSSDGVGGSVQNSGGFLHEDIEEALSLSNGGEFSVSSASFGGIVSFLLLADSSDGSLFFLGVFEELLSLDELSFGDVDLVGEVLDSLLEFDDLDLEVLVFLLHLSLEDGEVFGGLDFVLGEFVSGVFEVEDKSVDHDDDLLVEFVNINVDFGVSDMGQFLEGASGVVDVVSSDLSGGSLLGSGGGVDSFVESVDVLFDVKVLLDGLLEFGEDGSVFLIEEVGELGESLEEGSADFLGLLGGEVLVDVVFQESEDVDGFHVFSELLDEEEIVVASLLLEGLEHFLVGDESVLSGLFVVLGLFLLVLEEGDVLLEFIDVSLSSGDEFDGFLDLLGAHFGVGLVSDIGIFLFLVDAGFEVSEQSVDVFERFRGSGDEAG